MQTSSSTSWARAGIYLLAFSAILIAHVLLFVFAPALYDAFVPGEDRVVEWITFLGFFTAGVVVLSTLRQRSRMNRWTLCYLLGLGLFFLVCAGEEISWGQRIIGFETPERVAEINEQGEFNFHNLALEHLHPMDIVSWFMKLFGMILPLVAALLSRRRAFPFSGYLPALALAPCFAFPEIVNLFWRPISAFVADLAPAGASAAAYAGHLEELQEMYWGLASLLAAVSIRRYWTSRRGREQAPRKHAGAQSAILL